MKCPLKILWDPICNLLFDKRFICVIPCGPGELDLSRSMFKKDAMQFFPLTDPYPAGTKR